MRVPLPRVQQGRVLADWVATSLREAILNGFFERGEKIDQDLIAEQLKVSRTPVREALKSLEFEGFVEIRPHYGAFIPVVTPRDVREVYEVRALLEAEVVRQVTPVISEAVLDEIERSQAESLAELDAGNTTKHFESDIHFHQTLLDLVENPLIKEILDGLTNRISMVRRLAQSRPGLHLPESLDEHCSIIRAVRGRNADEAAELMVIHLRTSSLRIEELARELEKSPPVDSPVVAG
ncbi:MAG: GntR family transcriptional regulator [Anaerolineae bacterium]|nr:GntR family transcriptional regulator [Anaerolineae bacterium]